MKKFLLLALLVSTGVFASPLTDKLIGNYSADSETCGVLGNTKVTISVQKRVIEETDYLFVAFVNGKGEGAEYSEIDLNTKGKKFDCTPHANYSKVECKVSETKKSIESKDRGCLIICGPW